MNDHDLIIKLGTQMEYLIKEVQALRDGTKREIADLQTKVDFLEKADLSLRAEIKEVGTHCIEITTALALRTTALETFDQKGVTRHENNISYWGRLLIQNLIWPIVMGTIFLLLLRTGILNVDQTPIVDQLQTNQSI